MVSLLGVSAASTLKQGGSDDGTHEYWRVKGIVAGSFDGGGLAELEFKTIIGGFDLTAGGTPISGSEFAGRPDDNAFDNDLTTDWAGASGAVAAGTAWVGYQFLTPVNVNELIITGRSSLGSQMFLDFDIEHSDDNITWTKKWGVVGESSFSNGEARTFTSPFAAVADQMFTQEINLYVVTGQPPPDSMFLMETAIYVIE